MILDLHHIQIAIPKDREETARAFYSDVLGFSEVVKPNELLGRGGILLESGHVQLHLGVEDPFTPAKKTHPGFRVNSLKNTVLHLETKGITYRADIDLPNIKRVYIDDPFGNGIELLEITTN
jgi:catechol 2,3-dioxygenase-like lactoylglutathione lyase family enzyme